MQFNISWRSSWRSQSKLLVSTAPADLPRLRHEQNCPRFRRSVDPFGVRPGKHGALHVYESKCAFAVLYFCESPFMILLRKEKNIKRGNIKKREKRKSQVAGPVGLLPLNAVYVLEGPQLERVWVYLPIRRKVVGL